MANSKKVFYFEKAKLNLKVTEKQELRKLFLRKRLSLEEKLRETESEKINKKLKKIIGKARTIMAYSAFKKEPDLNELIQFLLKNKKKVLLPRLDYGKISAKMILSKKLKEKDKYGILCPKKDEETILPKKIDLILVPGIVFDKKGYRIGFGKAYYDRFLKETSAIKIGVAYDFQVIDGIKEEEHDIKLDALITPQNFYIFNPKLKCRETKG